MGWLGGGNQLGEACAHQLGYFQEEGLDFHVQPGGPNNDGIAIVASGRYEVGEVSSSPSLMLAASQDIPIRCFAVSAQKHPYTFFSLQKNPVRTPADFPGKKVGIQATGVILLRALLAKNKIDAKDVQIVTIGSDMMPLMTGQVDVVTGWLTNTTALKVLGPDRVDLRLWDTGVHLYANPYYATTDTLSGKRDMLVRFLRAASRGWAYAYAEPRQGDRAADEGVPQPQRSGRTRGGGRDVVLLLRRRHEAERLRHDGPEDLAGPDRHLEHTRPVLQADAEAR